jgi:hypothetical protein
LEQSKYFERRKIKMENDIQKRYPMTYAVLRNAADRITNWKNVTKQAKTRKRMEIANIVIALSNTL